MGMKNWSLSFKFICASKRKRNVLFFFLNSYFVLFFGSSLSTDQGDQERDLGMSVSPLFDREHGAIASSQKGFIKFIVRPLYEVWIQYLDSKAAQTECLGQLIENQDFWETWMGNQEEILNADKDTLRLDYRENTRGSMSSVDSICTEVKEKNDTDERIASTGMIKFDEKEIPDRCDLPEVSAGIANIEVGGLKPKMSPMAANEKRTQEFSPPQPRALKKQNSDLSG